MDTNNNHSRFLRHLDDSADAVWLVSRFLSRRGYGVTIPPTSRAVAHNEWEACADNGDILITQRVEVKRLGVDFTCREDWPFRDKFIVCAKHSFDRATQKPFAYIILSANMVNASAVFSSDSRCWTTEKRTDRRYNGVTQEFYLSPLDKVRFFNIATAQELPAPSAPFAG